MHKYHARPVVIDGIRFASTAEGYRYKELKIMERKGEIQKLVLQPKYELMSSYIYKGKRIQAITYSADFRYQANGGTIIEDVKGHETKEWRDKAKMFVKGFLVGRGDGIETTAKFYIIKKGIRHEWGEKQPRKKCILQTIVQIAALKLTEVKMKKHKEYSKCGVRLIHREYIEWLWTQPCAFKLLPINSRECQGDVVAAHGRPLGMRIKGPDNEAIPMCFYHHRLEHDGHIFWPPKVREKLVTEHNKKFNERKRK